MEKRGRFAARGQGRGPCRAEGTKKRRAGEARVTGLSHDYFKAVALVAVGAGVWIVSRRGPSSSGCPLGGQTARGHPGELGATDLERARHRQDAGALRAPARCDQFMTLWHRCRLAGVVLSCAGMAVDAQIGSVVVVDLSMQPSVSLLEAGGPLKDCWLASSCHALGFFCRIVLATCTLVCMRGPVGPAETCAPMLRLCRGGCAWRSLGQKTFPLGIQSLLSHFVTVVRDLFAHVPGSPDFSAQQLTR